MSGWKAHEAREHGLIVELPETWMHLPAGNPGEVLRAGQIVGTRRATPWIQVMRAPIQGDATLEQMIDASAKRNPALKWLSREKWSVDGRDGVRLDVEQDIAGETLRAQQYVVVDDGDILSITLASYDGERDAELLVQIASRIRLVAREAPPAAAESEAYVLTPADLASLVGGSTDPYDAMAKLRERGPVLKTTFGLTVVTAHDAANAVLKDDDNFSSASGAVSMAPQALASITSNMLFSDPPDHTRLRGVVSRAFTPRAVSAMEPRIREIAADLLGALQPDEPFEVVNGLATPLPVTVIAEMLGVGASDRDRFKVWSDALVAGDASAMAPALELNSFFADAIAARRERPGDDLISRMVEANENGVMTDEELMSACTLLLVAGNITTTNLIGNAVLALARDAGERRRLAAEPSLIATAVEESLRYDPPVQMALPRVAKQDVEIHGVPIAKGTQVLVFLASANRDEARFPDAARLDVGRTDAASHLAFGAGIHYCLGAPLARLEGRIALEALLARAPDFDLAEEPTYAGGGFLRGPTKLVIKPAPLA